MHIGTSAQLQPIGPGATNANGWVYGLFEFAIVVVPILLLTVLLLRILFWGKRLFAWMFRSSGSKPNDRLPPSV